MHSTLTYENRADSSQVIIHHFESFHPAYIHSFGVTSTVTPLVGCRHIGSSSKSCPLVRPPSYSWQEQMLDLFQRSYL